VTSKRGLIIAALVVIVAVILGVVLVYTGGAVEATEAVEEGATRKVVEFGRPTSVVLRSPRPRCFPFVSRFGKCQVCHSGVGRLTSSPRMCWTKAYTPQSPGGLRRPSGHRHLTLVLPEADRQVGDLA
jgi:hypothetical protein